MICDEYLEIRAQLGAGLFSLSTLAHGIRIGRQILQELQDLRASLRHPFLVVLLGESKSGKSSLANALLPSEELATGADQAEDQIYLFKYGPEEKTVPAGDQMSERYLPNAVLRDFNIVDTPGAGSFNSGHHELLKDILPGAELILVVFSIKNPWVPSAWELLARIDKQILSKAVFVLQQCDLRDDVEVLAVTKHLEQTIHEKLSIHGRVFPVSAFKAYLARTTGTDKAGLLKESGFGPLESYINDTVAYADDRLQNLRTVLEAGRKVLKETGDRVAAEFALVKKDSETVAELHGILEERKQQTRRLAGGVLWTLAESYHWLQKRGEQLLQQQLSFATVAKLTFNKGSTTEQFITGAARELEDSVQRQIQGAFELLEIDLHGTRKGFYDSIRSLFATESYVTDVPDLFEERMKALDEIESGIAEELLPMHARAVFARTASWLETAVETSLEPMIHALAAFAIRDLSGALAETVTGSRGMLALVTRSQKVAQFRAEMAKRREELLSPLETHLHAGIDDFYQATVRTLQPIQSFCAEQKAICEPRIAIVQQIDETFCEAGVRLHIPLKPTSLFPPQ